MLLDHVSAILGERVVVTHDLPSAPQVLCFLKNIHNPKTTTKTKTTTKSRCHSKSSISASSWLFQKTSTMQQNLNEEPKKILSPQINSSVPGLGGAAEFWHWDSITYVGNFIIRWFTLSSVSNSTLLNITIVLIWCKYWLGLDHFCWQFYHHLVHMIFNIDRWDRIPKKNTKKLGHLQ